MEKKCGGVDDLSVVGLVIEPFKLLWSHARVFALILVTFVLPGVILSEGLTFVLSISLSPYRIPSARSEIASSAVDGRGRSVDSVLLDVWQGKTGAIGTGAIGDNASPLQILGAIILCALVYQASRGLTVAALLHAVGLIYTGKAVSFGDVSHSAPRRWGRLMLTGVVYIPVVLSAHTVKIVFGLDWAVAASSMCDELFVSIVCGVMLGYIMHMSEAGTVFENGLAAFRKSRIFSDDKNEGELNDPFWKTSLVLLVLLMVPTATVGLLLVVVRAQYFEQGSWNWMFLLLAVLYCLVKAWLAILSSLAGGVLYAYRRARFGESIHDLSKLSAEENGVYGADGLAAKIDSPLLTDKALCNPDDAVKIDIDQVNGVHGNASELYTPLLSDQASGVLGAAS